MNEFCKENNMSRDEFIGVLAQAERDKTAKAEVIVKHA